MRHTILILFTGLLLTLTVSCDNWLDVRPQTEVKVDDNFKTAQGFKDALTGIYLLMSDQAIYGQELSFGMVDVLGKQYTTPFSASGQYYDLSQYNYTTDQAKGVIDPVWSKMYNVIANVNSLIEHINKADQTMFSGVEYNVIRGEAYALRAFLHFDLVRLFGPSYKTGASTKAIPYEETFDNQVTELSTVAEVITKALGDLTIAEQELVNDPVIENGGYTTETVDYADYLRMRHHKFNYYAVKLLQARIHLYKADYGEAFKAADAIIKQDVFSWVPGGTVTTPSPAGRNLVFAQELIFSLDIANLQTVMEAWDDGGYTKVKEQFTTVYETDQASYSYDYRYQYLTLDGGSTRYHIKLYQDNTADYYGYTGEVPIMRMSEAYYIAAECRLNQNDPEGAVGYLNTVRNARNLGEDLNLNPNLTKDQIQEEIFKEYAKEFVMEGQLFYYYKRINSPTIRFYTEGVSADTYVLPLPDDEVEGRLGE